MKSIKDILEKHNTLLNSSQPTVVETGTFSSEPVGKKVSCLLCEDRGIVFDSDRGRPCQCMKQKELLNKFKLAGISQEMTNQTFSSFSLNYYSKLLVDDKNRSYYEAAHNALNGAKEFVDAYSSGNFANGLMLTGTYGSGKTFLACAIANALMKLDVQVLFLVVPDLLDELRATYSRRDKQDATEQDLLDMARSVPVLILDDLGAHNYTDWTSNRIFSIVNYRMNYKLPTIITTNLGIDKLGEYLGERTSSRLLQMCRIFRLFVEEDIRLVKYKVREGKK
jgi:DNA replication protein DnaC